MELILYNGKVKTEDGFARAVACEDGRIKAVGTDEEVLALKTPDTKLVDLEGSLLLPGFNDSHQHFAGEGYYISQFNLRDIGSIENMIEQGKVFVAKNGLTPESGRWVEGVNWNDVNLAEKRMPNRYDLDKISEDIPIVASRVCGHIVSVNSKVLKMLDIKKGTPQPEGAFFEVDENGEPTGVLNEMFWMVSALMPKMDKESIRKVILLAADEALSKGLTSVQTDDFEVISINDVKDVIDVYMDMTEKGELPIRVCEQSCLPTLKELQEYIDRGYGYGYGNEYYRLGPLKLINDGSLGSRTAWMKEEYSDAPGVCGTKVYEDEELDKLVQTAHDAGIPVAVHCIGDAASEQVVNAVEKAVKNNPAKKVRHGIVHAQTLSGELCRRMAALDILAYIQPVFIQSDMDMAEDRLGMGSERMKYSYNWRTMADMGIRLSMGTDCPVEDMDPIANIYSAVTRRSIKNGGEPWHGEEALTVEEAVDMYTKASAYASGEEDVKGTIAVGKYADFTALDKDLYTVDPEEIKDAKVLMTVVGGVIRYSDKKINI